jgi:hypothetical protein
MCWKSCSSCWSLYLLREEFLSAPILSPPPLSGSPYRSFRGVDPRVLFIPSCPGYTGLTGALDRSDRCNPCWVLARVNVWVCSLLSCVVVVSSLG